jgi:hypothetical protein
MAAEDLAERLFDEYLGARRRGEHPDVLTFLDRAGADRHVLGRMIDVYLSEAPVVPPDEETLIVMNARLEGRTAIAELRERRGLSVLAVVERLQQGLNLAGSLTDRLREAYEDLERDWLDPRGVKPSVWTELRSIFGVDVRRLVSRQSEPAVGGVLMRREEPLATAAAAPAREARPRDAVDELFRGVPPSSTRT